MKRNSGGRAGGRQNRRYFPASAGLRTSGRLQKRKEGRSAPSLLHFLLALFRRRVENCTARRTAPRGRKTKRAAVPGRTAPTVFAAFFHGFPGLLADMLRTLIAEVKVMTNNEFMLHIKDNIYFQSQPESVQTVVIHSGAQLQNEQELQKFCEDLRNK